MAGHGNGISTNRFLIDEGRGFFVPLLQSEMLACRLNTSYKCKFSEAIASKR